MKKQNFPIFLAALGAGLLILLLSSIYLLDQHQERSKTKTFTSFAQEQAKCRETYENNAFRFKYKCNWNVQARPTEFNPDLTILSMYTDQFNKKLGNSIYIRMYLSDGFEAYEKRKPYIHIEEDEILINNTTYRAKQYSEHGGSTYMIHFDNSYIAIDSEDYLYRDKKDWTELFLILESLEIK
jgi:hypothetical protein